MDGQAESWVGRPICLEPHDFWLNITLGEHLSSKAKLAKAAGCYQVALALRPTSAAAWFNLGLARSLQKDYEGSVVVTKKAWRLTQLRPRVNNLGANLAYRNDQKGAMAAYRKAVEIDPRLGMAWRNLGTAWPARRTTRPPALHLPGNGRRAAEPAELGAAGRLSARPERLQGRRGRLRQGPGDHLRDASTWRSGRALASLQDYPNAAASFRKAAAIDPHNTEAWQLLIDLLGKQGDEKGVEVACRKAISFEPHDLSSWVLAPERLPH